MTRERCRYRARVLGRDTRVDDRQRAGAHVGDGLGKGRRQIVDRPHRTVAIGALPARELREVHVRIAHPQADPAVFDGAAAQARHALLVQLVIEERFVVRDDDQERHAVVDAGPQRGEAHQVVAVAQHRDRQPVAAGVAQRQRRTHRHPGSRSDAAAAVESDVVLRMREAAILARPAERQPDVRGLVRRQRFCGHAREVVERQAHIGGPFRGLGTHGRDFRGVGEPRANVFRRAWAELGEKGRDQRIGHDEKREIAHRQRLIVGVPAVVDVLIERALDDLGARGLTVAGLQQRAAEIDPVEAQNRVGVAHELRRRTGHVQAGRKRMQLVLGWETRAGLDVGENDGVQAFRERHASREIRFVARYAADHD
jgi:hypothetical protein